MDEHLTHSDSISESDSLPAMSFLQRALGIFHAPGRTFAYLDQNLKRLIQELSEVN